MKRLPKDFKKTNGLKVKHITVDCRLGQSPEFNIKDTSVSVRPMVSPCKGCDMIVNGSSVNSANFFELNGERTYSLGFNDMIHGYTYCLPENEKLAIDALRKQILSSFEARIIEIQCIESLISTSIEKIKKSVKAFDND